jgi:enoyl-CoA hydratase/carnithine racemase
VADELDDLQVTRRDAVVEVRLNRPAVRNAVNDALRDHLIATFAELADDDAVRVVILAGEGPAFCAGGDVSAMKERLAQPAGRLGMKGWRRIRHTERLSTAIHDLDKVTIAAVGGAAAGLGMDLALACDFILAADSAWFAMSYVLRGLIPDGGGLYYLPRRVGLARAKDLIYSGRRVAAAEALTLGIADRVVPAGELAEAAWAWAAEFAATAGPAVALSKAILNRSLELSARDVFALGAEAMAICYTTEEHQASVAEFLQSAKDRRQLS